MSQDQGVIDQYRLGLMSKNASTEANLESLSAMAARDDSGGFNDWLRFRLYRRLTVAIQMAFRIAK
jgi:hypothetical protein